MMHIVILGGGTAGVAAAMEIRKIDKYSQITIIEKEGMFGYSPCSLPYFLSGELKEVDIFYTDKRSLEDNSIVVLTGAEVTKIERKTNLVKYIQAGSEKIIHYDKLVLALGSRPLRPHIEGIEKALSLRTLKDAKEITKTKGKNVIVIGAGLAGIEIALAMKHNGMNVVLLEGAGRVAPGILDRDTSKTLHDHIEKIGITIHTNCTITKVDAKIIHCHESLKYDLLILATGVKPNIGLAEMSGIKCNWGIAVDDKMRTSDKNIYACGECAEVRHFLSGNPYVSQSGVTAYEQARVVALSITGSKVKQSRHVDSAVSVVAEGLFFGSTGVTAERALGMGIQTVNALYKGKDKSDYFPKAKEVTVKIVADTKGRIIGCQAIAETNISDLLNMASLAITKNMTVQDIIDSETCYNPAVAGIHHPLTMAAVMCKRKMENS